MQIPAGSVLSAQRPLFGVALAFSGKSFPLSALVEIPMTTTDLITDDELLQMKDDGFRYELVRGELIKRSPAGHQHGRIALNLTGPLFQYVKTHNLGAVYAAETGFKLAEDMVRTPDAAFIQRERVEEVGQTEGFWPGAPDLVAEVVSPGDTYAEVQDKIADWLDAGTRLVVVVNPSTQTVALYRSQSDIRVLPLTTCSTAAK